MQSIHEGRNPYAWQIKRSATLWLDLATHDEQVYMPNVDNATTTITERKTPDAIHVLGGCYP